MCKISKKYFRKCVNSFYKKSKKYKELSGEPKAAFRPEDFIEKFDYAPPPLLRFWFEFRKVNKMAMEALPDPHNGTRIS